MAVVPALIMAINLLLNQDWSNSKTTGHFTNFIRSLYVEIAVWCQRGDRFDIIEINYLVVGLFIDLVRLFF